MRWPWETKQDLREAIKNRDLQIAEMRRLTLEAQMKVSVLEGSITDARDAATAQRDRAEDIKEQLAYWKHLAENLFDRVSVLQNGIPIFHAANLPPDVETIPTEPSPEALRAQDEAEVPSGIPRSAILRNPRRHVTHTTLEKTIQHNRGEVRAGISDIQTFINSEGRRRAEMVEKAPTEPKVG